MENPYQFQGCVDPPDFQATASRMSLTTALLPALLFGCLGFGLLYLVGFPFLEAVNYGGRFDSEIQYQIDTWQQRPEPHELGPLIGCFLYCATNAYLYFAMTARLGLLRIMVWNGITLMFGISLLVLAALMFEIGDRRHPEVDEHFFVSMLIAFTPLVVGVPIFWMLPHHKTQQQPSLESDIESST